MNSADLIYFQSQTMSALFLAKLMHLESGPILRHDFLDGEFKLQLPENLSSSVYIYYTLDHPSDKFLELLFAARTARHMGVQNLTLIAPYLSYMRQDAAFHPGEVISQRIIGDLLASLFDVVITVDPHLHRITKLEEAIPVEHALVVSAAPLLGQFAALKRANPLLIGPDSESIQWIEQAALANQLDYAVAKKIRHSDEKVEIKLPKTKVKDRHVVLLDDIASSGHTLASAVDLILRKGAKTVDVAVTHALINADTYDLLKLSGIENIWSTDSVIHSTNVVSILPDIARALMSLNKD
ncbi:ribose-phosphate diphosphokinase [Polynucleobacter sp. MWH-UH23A]|uniref:ribose-phosphate diphosphokinase n=1 Tax=Polynucleobacter sp. MWH-UH23A TaxID=1855613 RepID=UPI003364B81D